MTGLIQIDGAVVLDVIFESVRDAATAPDLVTVAVSLFNYERFLGKCLDTVSQQLHQHIDLIIVDDASDQDDSLRAAQEWLSANGHRFARALLVRHARNQGLAQARNTAFTLSRSDPVFVLDADNQIYPRALSRLLGMIQAGNSAAYSQLEFFGEEKRLGYADFWSQQKFRRGNYVDAMAMVSKASWKQVGGYTPMDGWEDYDFWCKLIDAGLEAVFVPEILCRYRVHSSSMLRTDTARADESVRMQMVSRHPWLDL
ncbi:glycosyltransferase family 2 protein [Mesorhizobium sp. KR9-304]|uniref:glycosyltransferase family 2 protein n=1 Tax=Mesorhizobium sp. KR9-304 TaxID=3156614 RepID=UPI0032B368F7